ncbi:MAG TPA: FkbM family methyltransferase [Solirubrobacteraceae bacterium]
MSDRHRLVAGVARHAPARLARFVGRHQDDSRLLRWLGGSVKQSMRADGVIVHGQGAGLRFNAGGGNAGYALGTSEPAVQDALAELMRDGQVVYDIGANAGFYTVICARSVGARGQVVAFEPLPANLELVNHNVQINGFVNVTVLPYAIGGSRGRAGFTLGADSTRGGLTHAHAEPERAGTIEVDVRGLDELIAEGAVAAPHVIKMDIEGAEVDALNGAGALLAGRRPALLVEVHGTGRELESVLASHRYRWRLIGPAGPLPHAPLSEAQWGSYVVAMPE